MQKHDAEYQSYLSILKEELVPAMGCTEPIAIAYAAAYARDMLGGEPDGVRVEASGNLLKNVKSVIVPNTNGLKGIPAAVSAGIIGGKTDKLLEVISEVSPESRAAIADYMGSHPIAVTLKQTPLTLDFTLEARRGEHVARVRIANLHTNIVLAELDGVRNIDRPADDESGPVMTDRSILNVEDICAFADMVDLDEVREPLEKQVAYNYAIAEAGMTASCGTNIGRVIVDTYGDSLPVRAKAMAAAASDMRMNGCEMPVVIVSGSGNQGIAASVPVIAYGRGMNVPEDRLLRAVLLSDLITIHQKTRIGRLSAFCGAVCAGAGAGSGICYLLGGGYVDVAHTIVNALAMSSGLVCDGAKSSCAAKIALAVEAGILGCAMYRGGRHQFRGGDGIVTKGVENTIANVGRLGHDGMRETDQEILRIMIGEKK